MLTIRTGHVYNWQTADNRCLPVIDCGYGQQAGLAAANGIDPTIGKMTSFSSTMSVLQQPDGPLPLAKKNNRAQ